MKKLEVEINPRTLEVELEKHTSGTRLIPWPKGEDWKTPTEEQLLKLILPNIPDPIPWENGRDGLDWETPEIDYKKIIKEIPKEEDIIKSVLKKIPKPKDGDKWQKGEDGKSFRFADLTPYEKQILTWPQGSNWVWVPRYGTAGQILVKASSKDFDTEWITGGGGGAVDSVNWQTGVVVLDTDDISDTATTNKFVTASDITKLGNLSGTNTWDVTVSDSSEIDFTLTGQQISASIVSGSIDETKLDTSVNASLDLADTAVQPATLSSYEVLSNKSTDTALGTSDTLYPTQNAVKTYVDNSVVWLLDDRGNYDASVNTFPASGGSGTAGAILKWDSWFINVAGTLGGAPVVSGDNLRALVDTPWQTASNWSVLEWNIGYVPENVANKENTTIDTNTTKYPTVNLLKTGLDTKQATLVSGTNIKTVNSTTLLGSGDLAVATTAQGALADTALQPANISDTAYDATSWNWVTTIAPSKNAIRDKIETMDSAIALNTAKVTNATHSGDIVGATSTTAQPAIITGKPSATVASGDLLLIADVNDSNALKQVTAQSIADLWWASGATTALDNLASVAINTSLVSDTDNTDDLGTTLKKWANLFVITIGATATRVTKWWFTDLEITNAPTIGGTAATGTGGLVRAGSPALITPSMAAIVVSGWTLTLPTGASDTLVSKNSTDTLTNKSISGWQITSAVANATDSVKVGGVTITGTPNAWDVPIATSGTAATWWAPAGWWASTKCYINSNFETKARFAETTTGSGATNTFNDTGASIVTSNSTQGSMKIVWSTGGNELALFANSPKMTQVIKMGNLGFPSATTTGSIFMGIWDITVSNTAHTFTQRHIGFKVLYSGGAHTLFATHADWTTENASSALTSLWTGCFHEICLELDLYRKLAPHRVDYYWRKNGGALIFSYYFNR
jgi:hypothetical protein